MPTDTVCCVETNQSMTIDFGAPRAEAHVRGASPGLRLPVTLLAGEGQERIFRDIRAIDPSDDILLFETGDLLLGCALQPVGDSPAQCAHELYRRLLRATAGRSLCRIWNYVPEINRVRSGLENYRAFNAGRAQAFEEFFGSGYKQVIPAGSAVGCGGDAIAVVFAADRGGVQFFENPEQMPAYEYPPEHGPRPPSFSRAAVTTSGGRPLVFISGTAAIKGHGTVAPGVFLEQLDCTLDNLRLISRETVAGG